MFPVEFPLQQPIDVLISRFASGEVEYQLSDAIFNQKLGTNRIFVLFLGQLHFLAVKSLHGNKPFMHMDINPICCKHRSYICCSILLQFISVVLIVWIVTESFDISFSSGQLSMWLLFRSGPLVCSNAAVVSNHLKVSEIS